MKLKFIFICTLQTGFSTVHVRYVIRNRNPTLIYTKRHESGVRMRMNELSSQKADALVKVNLLFLFLSGRHKEVILMCCSAFLLALSFPFLSGLCQCGRQKKERHAAAIRLLPSTLISLFPYTNFLYQSKCHTLLFYASRSREKSGETNFRTSSWLIAESFLLRHMLSTTSYHIKSMLNMKKTHDDTLERRNYTTS